MLRLLQWVGVDRSQLPAEDALQFEWAHMPTSLGLFALVGVVAALAYGVAWVYRRELDTASLRTKYTLAALRVAVLLVLVLIFLGPEVVRLDTKEIQRTLLLVRDKSQSMAFEDIYRDELQAAVTAQALGISPSELQSLKPARATVLDRVLAKDDYNFLRQLDERGRLLVVDFDDALSKPIDPRRALVQASGTPVTPVSHPGEAENLDPKTRPIKLEPVVADGRGSDLWLAIHESLASRTPAAIVLFSDGQHTGREDPREAAREAARQNVKLYTVGVGDASRPKNLRVDSVYVQPNLWKKDEFGVEVTISAQDIDPQNIEVQLLEQKVSESDGSLSAEKEVVRKTVLLNKTRLMLRLSHSQQESGKYVYSVRVPPIEDGPNTEANFDDNRASAAPTTVRDKDHLKVLLVAGAPTWEYRLVQKLLTRDETIHVSCWLQTLDEDRAQDGDRPPISRLPLTLQELNEYGVILLFDPNPMEFDEKWIETLTKYVSEHAGGVLFMAGPKYTGQFLSHPRTEGIRTVLPVSFGDVAAVQVRSMMELSSRAYPLRVVPANSDHDMLSFYDDRGASQQRWESLPGIFWSFPSVAPKPTAQVLLEHSDATLRTSEGARPLLVTNRYGAGNTAFIAFNGTWRWRQMGRDAEFFDKFWVKTVRYLADARSSKGRQYGSLLTDKDRYEVGDKIAITARLLNASYDPLEVPEVEATLRTEDGTPISVILKPVMNQPSVYEGFTAARRPGVHTLSVDIPASEGVKPTVDDKNFTVELPRVEMNQQWLNKPLLVELASMTGGKYFDLHELDKLAAEIPDQTEKIIERGKSTSIWDLPALWDVSIRDVPVLNLRTTLLLLLVGLLSVEWAVRKRVKLL